MLFDNYREDNMSKDSILPKEDSKDHEIASSLGDGLDDFPPDEDDVIAIPKATHTTDITYYIVIK